MQLTEKQKSEGWRIVKFGEIAKSVSKRVDPADTDLEVYVGLEHLDPDNLRITRRGVPSDVKGQKLLVKPGQIIFGKRRAYQRKVAVADFEGICSAHAMVLEAIPEAVVPEYLPFFMQSDMFMERAVAISEGSLSPTIKWKTLANQEFPLPPRPRQEEMLEVFEKIEEVEQKTINLLKLSKTKIDLAIKILFSDGAISKDKISDVGEVVAGKNAAINKSLSEGVRMITLPCVSKDCELSLDEDEMAFIESQYVKTNDYVRSGDILFNWRNGSPDHVGKSAYIIEDYDYVHVGFLLRIIADKSKISSKFLFWYMCFLKKTGFFTNSKHQVNKTFNKSELNNLDVERFSAETEIKIEKTLNTFESLQETSQRRLDNFKTIKRQIYREYFNKTEAA